MRFFFLDLLPLNLRSGECDVVSFYVLCCSINGSVCFVCCVFDSVVKQFAICLGVFAILLLHAMDLLSVVGGALLDISCMLFVKIMLAVCILVGMVKQTLCLP